MNNEQNHPAQAGQAERRVMRDASFIAIAVSALRKHRYSGAIYPENGWPDINVALAQYAKQKRTHNAKSNRLAGDKT